MIVTKREFKKRYAYGGSGIFDTIAYFLTRIFTSSAARQIASPRCREKRSQGGCEESSRGWKTCYCRCGKEVSYENLNAKMKENFTKTYATRNTRH